MGLERVGFDGQTGGEGEGMCKYSLTTPIGLYTARARRAFVLSMGGFAVRFHGGRAVALPGHFAPPQLAWKNNFKNIAECC
jgi:hypothetical protein